MRRFSQRNSLVTLNEINITPLLDIAFVLLLIFIITRPLLEQSMELQLPAVGAVQSIKSDDKNLQTVEINAAGELRLNGKPASMLELEGALISESRRNPDIAVRIRSDKQTPWNYPAQVMGICMRNNITKIAAQTLEH
jgi:biopolymer transport protein ExbD